MSNLEWINEQIKECDEMIERLNIRKDEYSKNKSLVKTYNNHIKNLTGLKQRFEQIKSEFEAWEVVKIKTLITDGGVIHMAIENEDEGYETVIKALEAKNECRN